MVGHVPESCPETAEIERRLRLMLGPGGDDTALLNFLAGKGGLEVEPEAVTGRAIQLYRVEGYSVPNEEETYPGANYQDGAEFMLARERALREIVGEIQYNHETYNKYYREALRDPHVGDKWLDAADGSVISVKSVQDGRLTYTETGGTTRRDNTRTIALNGFAAWARVCSLRLRLRQHTRHSSTSF